MTPEIGMLTVIFTAKVFYLAFAFVTLLGGLIGFIKAKSLPSLIAGAITGAMLIVASLQLPARPIVSGVVALIASVALAGKFVPDLLHKKAFLPSGLMALLSVASIVLTILALLPK